MSQCLKKKKTEKYKNQEEHKAKILETAAQLKKEQEEEFKWLQEKVLIIILFIFL